MSMDVEVLIEAYTILKQYIPQKDRQEAVDNLMSVMVDMLSDEELNNFGGTDSTTKRALKEYSSDDDGDEDEDGDGVEEQGGTAVEDHGGPCGQQQDECPERIGGQRPCKLPAHVRPADRAARGQERRGADERVAEEEGDGAEHGEQREECTLLQRAIGHGEEGLQQRVRDDDREHDAPSAPHGQCRAPEGRDAVGHGAVPCAASSSTGWIGPS